MPVLPISATLAMFNVDLDVYSEEVFVRLLRVFLVSSLPVAVSILPV